MSRAARAPVRGGIDRFTHAPVTPPQSTMGREILAVLSPTLPRARRHGAVMVRSVPRRAAPTRDR